MTKLIDMSSSQRAMLAADETVGCVNTGKHIPRNQRGWLYLQEAADKYSTSFKQVKRARRILKTKRKNLIADVRDGKVSLQKAEEIIAGRDARKTKSQHFREYLLEQANGKCSICGKKITAKTLAADHIVPLAKGGEDHFSNLQATCEKCNFVKGEKLI